VSADAAKLNALFKEEPFFWGLLSTAEAGSALASKPIGTYLGRWSKHANAPVISFVGEREALTHAKVVLGAKGELMLEGSSKTFDDVQTLLKAHQQSWSRALLSPAAQAAKRQAREAGHVASAAAAVDGKIKTDDNDSPTAAEAKASPYKNSLTSNKSKADSFDGDTFENAAADTAKTANTATWMGISLVGLGVLVAVAFAYGRRHRSN
jgi:hypothetical protein